MALTQDSVVWTGKTVGLTLESYNDKFTLKSVRSFESQGDTKIGYDWSFPQEYDKDSKKWKPREKAIPVGVYLGERDKAIEALEWFLKQLNVAREKDDVPF